MVWGWGSSSASAWTACIALQILAESQRTASDSMSARLQSLTSRALGADLHPAAHFGKGVFIAHPLGVSLPVRALLFRWVLSWSVGLTMVMAVLCMGVQAVCMGLPCHWELQSVLLRLREQYAVAGIVVGEAARVGDHVTIMQHVTLGGTGNEPGDRHPKIGSHVQIGVKATILGAYIAHPLYWTEAEMLMRCPLPEHPLIPGFTWATPDSISKGLNPNQQTCLTQ